MKKVSALVAVATFLLLGFTAACTNTSESAKATNVSAPADADKEWSMPNKNYASNRFSTLDAINTENVKNLKVAWSFSTGVLRGHEGGPLVVGSTMYVHTPFPDIVYALDLTKEG